MVAIARVSWGVTGWVVMVVVVVVGDDILGASFFWLWFFGLGFLRGEGLDLIEWDYY